MALRGVARGGYHLNMTARARASDLWRQPGRSANTGLRLTVAVGLAAIALYLPAIAFDLLFDDLSLLGENGPAGSGGLLPYRPLRHLAWLSEYWLAGLLGRQDLAVSVYHLANLLLFGGVAATLWCLCRRLGANSLLALLCCVACLAHPLWVESVAYVSGARDLLATLFTLLALLAWSSADPGQDKPGQAAGNGGMRAGALALLAALAATASKETGLLVAPLLLLMWASGLGPLRRGALVWIVMVAVASSTLMVAYGGVGVLPATAGVLLPASPYSFCVGGTLALHYAAGLLVPLDLSVDYPALWQPCVGMGAAAWLRAGLGLVLLAALAASVVLAWRSRKGDIERRQAAFVVSWIAAAGVALIFVAGVNEPGADRHSLLLLPPLVLGMGLLLQQLSQRQPGPRAWPPVGRIAALLLLCCVFVLAGITLHRQQDWRSQAALWRSTVAVQPNSPRAHYNLAVVAADRGRRGLAQLRLERLLKRWPDYQPALLARARLACAGGALHRAGHFLGLAAGKAAGNTAADRAATDRAVLAVVKDCPGLAWPQ